MTHEIPELDRRGLRDFGLVTGAVLAAIFGLFLPWLLETKTPTWPWALGAALALWGLAAPMSLNPVYRLWMRFGLLMSKITTPIILGVVFYLLFSPIGFFMRLFGRDTMARTIDDSVESYRIENKKPAREKMERPF